MTKGRAVTFIGSRRSDEQNETAGPTALRFDPNDKKGRVLGCRIPLKPKNGLNGAPSLCCRLRKLVIPRLTCHRQVGSSHDKPDRRDDKGEGGDFLLEAVDRTAGPLHCASILMTKKGASWAVVSHSSQKRLEWGTQPSLPVKNRELWFAKAVANVAVC